MTNKKVTTSLPYLTSYSTIIFSYFHLIIKQLFSLTISSIKRLVILFLHIYTNNLYCQSILLENPAKILTIEDGLVSNLIYGSIQDDNDFIWFFSDKGLTRFDGFNTKSFTTENGLTSSNIWMVNKDDKNRLWLFTHDNYLSYAKGDSIQIIDSFNHTCPLNMIRFFQPDTIMALCRRMEYCFYFFENNKIKVKHFSSFNNSEKVDFMKKIDCIYNINYDSIGVLLGCKFDPENTFRSGYSFCYNNTLYSLSVHNNKFLAYSLNYRNGIVLKFQDNNRFYWPLLKNNKLILPSTKELLIFNEHKIEKKYTINLNINILRSDEDISKNVWVGTQNNGVLFFASNLSRYLVSKYQSKSQINNAISLAKLILIETLSKELIFFENNNKRTIIKYDQAGIKESGYWFDNNLWLRSNSPIKLFNLIDKAEINFLNKNKLLTKIDKELKFVPYQSIIINKDSLISINSNECQLITRSKNQFHIKLLFNHMIRIYNSYLDSNKLLHIISLNNIYHFDKYYNLVDSTPLIYNNLKLSATSILKYTKPDLLLIGTNGQGIYSTFYNKQFKHLPYSNKVECKSLSSIKNYLIAHTNQGIFSYIYKDGEFKFNTVYANSYGLNPDDIKLVYPYNDSIHVVTKNSVLAFSPDLIDKTQDTLRVYECLVNGHKAGMVPEVTVPYDFSQLSFRFSTFNYTRMDDTKFRYRFKASDQWIILASNLIELSQLASGKYNLEIEAFNQYSNELLASANVKVNVTTPWYKSMAFIFISNILLIAFAIITYRLRTERKRRIDDNLRALEHSLRESKIKVLENQMNPHFLFNSLTSIKSFIKSNDLKNADYFLGYFSKLMRLYLDSSRNSTLSIKSEIELIEHYLILERMRFEERFDFKIDIDPILDIDTVLIPTMLIQPLVENSIRHGLFHRTKGGQLNIKYYAVDSNLIIEITDNGIGIKKSMELKADQQQSHQSHATRIIKEKIELLNSTMDYKIVMDISELQPNDPNFKGTRILIRLLNIL